jgi:diguanylate cyclase (GGDEF)-like protein
MSAEVPPVPKEVSQLHPLDPPERAVVLNKAKRILEENKLEITKVWLNRLITQIHDLRALQRFPTQETIRTSVELIEGLANCLSDEDTLSQFGPGGLYFRQASALGLLQHDDAGGIGPLIGSLDALEEAIWEQLEGGLRQQDKEILELVRILRLALHRVMMSAAEAYHRQSSAELDRLAHTDTLTNLHNRRYLEQELDRHVELYKRYRHPFALLMLDLDSLKLINDTFGHAAGDEAIRHLAAAMRVNIRDTDIPCRYGGDEFVILMPEADRAAIDSVGKRIAESISKDRLRLGGGMVSLEVSFGAGQCPADGTTREALLKVADSNLYAAKERKTGRGRL